MRAIRRFTVRPVLPEPLRRWATWRPTCGGPGTPRRRTSSRPSTPTSGESSGHDPVKTLGAVSTARLAELAERQALPADARAGPRRPRAVPHRRPLVPEVGRRRRRRRRSRYFSPEYGITSVLPQYSGGLGILAGDHLKTASDLGVPLDRRRAALPARLLPPAALPRGLAAGDLPGARPRRAADHAAARGRRHRRRRSPSTCPGDADAGGAHLRRAGGPGAAAAARLRRRGEPGAAARGDRPAVRRQRPSTGCSRSCCSASAASARCGRTRGSPAPRSPRCSTPTRATPASSASSGSASSPSADDGPRLDFDTALEVTRAGTVFTTHTPVPAGIDRFPRELIEQYFGAQQPAARRPARPDPGARRRGLRGRRRAASSTWR